MVAKSLPLWLTDESRKPVYFNARMRELTGLTASQVSGLENFKDIMHCEEQLYLPPPGELGCTLRRLRCADGEYHLVMNYLRRVDLHGRLYGYIGVSLPIMKGGQLPAITPTPLKRIPSHSPKLSFGISGVLMDHVSAYAKVYGPFIRAKNSLDCTDLELFQKELKDVFALQPIFPFDAFSPSPTFMARTEAFAGLDFELINDKVESGEIRAMFPTKGVKVASTDFAINHQDAVDWLHSKGLTSVTEVDARNNVTFFQKLHEHSVDAHLEHDPEAWIVELFEGIPSFLMDRPWNQQIPTKFRVYSLEEYLDGCGVVADTTSMSTAISQFEDMIAA